MPAAAHGGPIEAPVALFPKAQGSKQFRISVAGCDPLMWSTSMDHGHHAAILSRLLLLLVFLLLA